MTDGTQDSSSDSGTGPDAALTARAVGFGRWAAPLAGLLSTLGGLAAGEAVAALGDPAGSPVTAVGSSAIDLAPTPVKEFAVATFGNWDKPLLVGGVLLALAGLSALAGRLAVRRGALALGVVAAVGLTGVVAAATRPGATALTWLPALASVLVNAVLLLVLARRLRDWSDAATTEPVVPRRTFLLASGVTAVGAAGVGIGARTLGAGRHGAEESRAGLVVPRPTDPARPLPAGYRLSVPGISPFFTPVADFYRVDTALRVPAVPAETWTLRLDGAVRRPTVLSMSDLLSMELVERDITLACVSNEVGGPYVSTGRWVGVRLADLLRRAGVRTGADQVLSHSLDGMTIGTPTETVLDGRDALVAVALNGEPLPLEHGFPARLVVPGLYGYASATKWLSRIELTSFATADAYWVRRGWARRAPVKTAARIDVPRPFASLAPGRVNVAGVAYAQHRGVAGVEVRVDGGPWREARLTTQVTPDLWRQWVFPWQAAEGSHTLEVRATDGTGTTQPGSRVPPFPDGATGWHSVVVSVG